jgi:hypothetical protein
MWPAAAAPELWSRLMSAGLDGARAVLWVMEGFIGEPLDTVGIAVG